MFFKLLEIREKAMATTVLIYGAIFSGQLIEVPLRKGLKFIYLGSERRKLQILQGNFGDLFFE